MLCAGYIRQALHVFQEVQDLFTVQENTGVSICAGGDLMKESSKYWGSKWRRSGNSSVRYPKYMKWCIRTHKTKLAKTRVLTAQKPAGPPYLVMSSSAAWEHSCIWDTSSVAKSTACWMYKWVRRTGLPESHFCLSSQDFRVLSKAYLKINITMNC